jgi:hypothetical protein
MCQDAIQAFVDNVERTSADRALLQQALGNQAVSPNHGDGPRLSPSRRAVPVEETAQMTTLQAEHTMAGSSDSTSSIKPVIPLEIALRIGDRVPPAQRLGLAAPPPKVLTRGAEAVQVEARRRIGAPQSLPAVDVNHWRVPIEKIETLTNLAFGNAVRAADTIKVAGQPNVGESSVLIKGFQRIQL